MSSQTSDTNSQSRIGDADRPRAEMVYQAVGHRGNDDVAIVTRDLSPGELIHVRFLDGSEPRDIKVAEEVPLGHKIALRSVSEDEKVTEYGRFIGRAVSTIKKGTHVHVHNLKSLRW